MLLDAQLLFSDAQAVTADAASTNIVNLSFAHDLGVGTPVYVFVTVDVAMTDSGSDSTLSVILELDTTTTLTPDQSHTLMIIPATSAAGASFFAQIPPSLVYGTSYQYMGLQYTPNNGNLTTGTFTSGVVLDIARNTHYADGFTIST